MDAGPGAKALGMKVIATESAPLAPFVAQQGIELVDFDTLLARSDVLSLHAPLMPATTGIINAAAIAKMKRGAVLINTARGLMVNERDLVAALESGRLAGAGIDVLPAEPPALDDPLIVAWRDPCHPAHHRVIINPHAAFYSEEGLLDMRMKGAKAVANALLGKPLLNIVN